MARSRTPTCGQIHYGDRHSPFNVNIQAIWTSPEDGPELMEWSHGFADDLGKYSCGAYVNFLSRWSGQQIFGTERYRRLVDVKKAYDPDNIFRPGGLDLATDRTRFDLTTDGLQS